MERTYKTRKESFNRLREIKELLFPETLILKNYTPVKASKVVHLLYFDHGRGYFRTGQVMTKIKLKEIIENDKSFTLPFHNQDALEAFKDICGELIDEFIKMIEDDKISSRL